LPDVPISYYRVILVGRGGQRVEIGSLEVRDGRPVVINGVGDRNGPKIAEWLNRERLGLSPDDVARITASGPRADPGEGLPQ